MSVAHPAVGAMIDGQTIIPVADGAEHYAALRRVLDEAFAQSATGKGRERHARGKPFLEQPIMEIARMVGLGGHTYQVCKKAQEATAMAARHQHDAAKAEMLGIIVYAAAGYLLIEEQQAKDETNGQ